MTWQASDQSVISCFPFLHVPQFSNIPNYQIIKLSISHIVNFVIDLFFLLCLGQ